MRQTIRLLHAHRITLFTRANCSLCDHAKAVLSKAWDKRPFDYTEIDVMAPGQKKWKDIYEFDTPVIHVEPVTRKTAVGVSSGKNSCAGPAKAMHRFSEEEVLRLMDVASECRHE